ncbi:hypothetical protein KI387_016044 [Taxus chinensis]|uniref:Uncharacterized protein n=1 Tax=Taxus chinensis TaxID=29808 RepID=A0AA38GHD3_TAXCH|nr:hypothetical protein KI387_016044 [Taxus chinensis]
MKQLQNLGNELVTIKRQQAQSARPYQPQAQYQARPPYQQNRPPPQAANQNQNQGQPQAARPFRPYDPNATTSSRALVPTQNNMAQEYDWCYPCNLPHNQSACFNGALNQALMVQTIGVAQEPSQEENQQQQTQQEGPPTETTLANWQTEDFCGVNQQPFQGVAANTRSKKRNIGEGQSCNPVVSQPTLTQQGVSRPNAAPNVQNQPKVPVVATHAHAQAPEKFTPSKGHQKDNSSPFNIIDQMKKTNVNISMWESLSIPGQRDLLQATMNNWLTSNQQAHMQEKVLRNAA